jgi:hypothetical protein
VEGNVADADRQADSSLVGPNWPHATDWATGPRAAGRPCRQGQEWPGGSAPAGPAKPRRRGPGRGRFDAVVDFAGYTGGDARQVVEALGGKIGHYVFIGTGQVYLVRQNCPRPSKESDYEGRPPCFTFRFANDRLIPRFHPHSTDHRHEPSAPPASAPSRQDPAHALPCLRPNETKVPSCLPGSSPRSRRSTRQMEWRGWDGPARSSHPRSRSSSHKG